MGGETVLHGHGSPRIQWKSHFSRIREIEWDAPPLDHSAIDVGPFDFEKAVPCYGFIEAIDKFNRLLSFNCLRQHELIGSRSRAERSTKNLANDQQADGGPRILTPSQDPLSKREISDIRRMRGTVRAMVGLVPTLATNLNRHSRIPEQLRARIVASGVLGISAGTRRLSKPAIDRCRH